MYKEVHQLIDIFGSRGLKNIRGRKIILRELEARKNHFSAENLYSSLTRKGTRVSRPTIYRILKLLERFRLIERFDIKKNCFYYEPVDPKKYHGHLICEQCGKIVDFPCEKIEILKSEVAKEKDFKLGNISIQVFGVCKSCQKVSTN